MPPKPRTLPPRHLAALNQLIRNHAAAHSTTELRLRSTIANTVVGQMLPSGVVKGGTAMKFRQGGDQTRFSVDLDVTRGSDVDPDDYLDQLRANLEHGWHGFTGRLVVKQPAAPVGVPGEYVMTPFEVKLAYNARSWTTVVLEIAREEIDSLTTSPLHLAPDIRDLFVAIGFPSPDPIPVLALDHQIAQKLHGCSAPGSDRAHDLVDLQLLAREPALDLAATNRTARRLFAARQGHQWPTIVTPQTGWDSRYLEAATGLDVIPNIDEATNWVNNFIATITAAG